MAGLLRLGRLARFVSNAVMVGFLTGVSLLIVLSQLGDFSGYASPYSNKVVQTVDLLLHLGQVHVQTLLIGVLTVILILLFNRTRVRNFSMLLAMVIASGAVLALGWDRVQTVRDIADIPSGIPVPRLPDLALIPGLILPAISVAIIGLVQGAGISRAYPNTDGDYPDVSRDFSGMGAANVAASLFQGMPVGGSVGTTALNVSAGARSRWANLFSGVLVAGAVLLFSRAVSSAAMPAMAALLIVAGVQSINREELLDVWDVGWGPRATMLVTFVFTLVLPVQWAVFVGVFLSIMVFYVTAAQDVRLVEYVPLGDGTYREQPAPAQLPSHAITLLNVYGSLFYAGAAKLEEMLPSPENAERPVVILRLREHSRLRSTFINVLERYEVQLQAKGGKLILSGVGARAKAQLERTETTSEVLGADNVFFETEIVGASTRDALAAARRWLDE
jgi:SulP family sulfate permease